jgi:C_GCAxxG_C_C family probable redox protein
MAAYGDELGLDRETAVKLANAFGGGMGRMGEVCGAVTGAYMIISLTHGASSPQDELSKEITYELVIKFAELFKHRNESIICKDLIGFNLREKDLNPDASKIIWERCPGYVKDAAEIVEKLI